MGNVAITPQTSGKEKSAKTLSVTKINQNSLRCIGALEINARPCPARLPGRDEVRRGRRDSGGPGAG